MALRAFIPIGIVLLLAGCQREQWDDCITSTGPQRSEERTVSQFHKVKLDDRIDLVFDHLPATTIVVEAGRNLIDQVITEVEGGTLSIENGNRCNWVRSFKPRITVRVPIAAVNELELTGTGNISSADTIRCEEFRIEQWGAMGTADLLIDAQRIFIGLHTGAGDVVLRGSASDHLNLYSGHLGTIDATLLRSPTVNINNSGVGDFRCWSVEHLNVQINDAGDVYYRGDPALIESSINGSGALIRIE